MKQRPDVIWYRKPAVRWQQALPLGNGRMGAMVYGGADGECIDLTESTFVSGEASDGNNSPGAPEAYRAARDALLKRDYVEGNKLAEGMTGLRLNFGTNLPVGRLMIRFEEPGEPEDYRRSLDISRGVSRVEFASGGKQQVREAFLSHADGVLAMRIAGGRAFTVRLESDCPISSHMEGGDLVGEVRARETRHSDGQTGVTLHLRLRLATPGSVKPCEGGFTAKPARESVLLLAMNTDFEGFGAYAKTFRQIEAASAMTYDELLRRHEADITALTGRCVLEMGEASGLPADEWIKHVQKAGDNGALAAMMFRYGRYLFLASSREDSPLPAHLQGAWNDGVACRIGWSCDMHLDVNTQMNYWPAHATGLHECALPLHRWVSETLVPSGRRTARETYGLSGWVAHTISNAWGYSAPGQSVYWGLHATGGVWIATHMWEYWLHTLDRAFLRDKAYPVIRGAVEFFADYLVKDDQTGYYLPVPSDSPENSFALGGRSLPLSKGATCDVVMIRELFGIYGAMCGELGLIDELADRARAMAQNLPPFRVGKHGQLQEWLEDFDEATPNHRHMSHLLSLYPFSQIDPDTTPELAAAACRTMERRTGAAEPWEDTGWARSLLILFCARLHDGEAAGAHVLSMMRTLTNDNLFVFHPPVAGADTNVYELDGNTGLTSGIAEMLLQSHGGALRLLPALPPAWRDGRAEGLRGRGGFVVDIEWKNGELVEAYVTNDSGGRCRVKYRDRLLEPDIRAGERLRLVF